MLPSLIPIPRSRSHKLSLRHRVTQVIGHRIRAISYSRINHSWRPGIHTRGNRYGSMRWLCAKLIYLRARQALNCFDGLKDAWMARKQEIEARVKAIGGAGLFGGGYGGYGGANYGQAQELNRLEQVSHPSYGHTQSYLTSTLYSWSSKLSRTLVRDSSLCSSLDPLLTIMQTPSSPPNSRCKKFRPDIVSLGTWHQRSGYGRVSTLLSRAFQTGPHNNTSYLAGSIPRTSSTHVATRSRAVFSWRTAAVSIIVIVHVVIRVNVVMRVCM